MGRGRRQGALTGVGAALLLVALPQAAGAAGPTTEAVSVTGQERFTAGHTPGDAPSAGGHGAAVTPGGRFVAFTSSAALVPEDTNREVDVYVRDRVAGTTERVSVTSTGRQTDRGAGAPSISDDGRYVVFQSDADALAFGTTGPTTRYERYAFVHDRVTRRTSRLPDSQYVFARISGGGRYVLHSDGRARRFDRQTGRFLSVDLTPTGGGADDESYAFDISPDGRYVLFYSCATNLVPLASQARCGSDDWRGHTYVRDVVAGRTTLVSATSAGRPLAHGTRPLGVSADGRRVLLEVLEDRTDTGAVVAPAVYLKDLVSGRLQRVHTPVEEWLPVLLSRDGSRVAFAAEDRDSGVAGDTNRWQDVFVKRVDGGTTRVSVPLQGGQANGPSSLLALSPDGRSVVFASTADDLVPGDRNSSQDVFVRSGS